MKIKTGQGVGSSKASALKRMIGRGMLLEGSLNASKAWRFLAPAFKESTGDKTS